MNHDGFWTVMARLWAGTVAIGALLLLTMGCASKPAPVVTPQAPVCSVEPSPAPTPCPCPTPTPPVVTVPAKAPTPKPAPKPRPSPTPSTSVLQITICHRPPGNPANAKTLWLASVDAMVHLRDHAQDTEGVCP